MIFVLRLLSGLITLLSVAHCKGPPSVIIIGAGASGIASATKLLENGINFTVLEAQQRIGGRIYSVKFGDAMVDLGAQWSHGEQNNVMFELVKHLDLLRLSNFRNHFHHSNEDFDVKVTERLFRLCKEILSKEAPPDEQTVGGFVTTKFHQRVIEAFGNNKEILKHADEVLNSFHHEVLMQKGAFSWNNLSMLNNYDLLKGNTYLNWNGLGHGVILDVMMKKYPNPKEELPIADKILFGKEVVEIEWDGDQVVVRCADKSEYVTDHVILTMSIGVLKSTYENMFKPPLPNNKVNAITNLGFEAVIRVALHFPNKWWMDSDFQTALLCWNSDDLAKLSEEFKWLENLYKLHIVEKNPNVLIAWFTGEFVPQIESLEDDTLIDGITFVLKQFFGRKYTVTAPDRILRHNWYSNSYFRGVYSFETVKSRQGNEFGAVILSKPLKSRTGKLALLFGGEASSPTHYATVHGAIETGYREAQRIIDLYK